MGQETSVPNSHVFANDNYLPISEATSFQEEYVPTPSTKSSLIYNKKMLRSAFFGIWSLVSPSGICPKPRKGHFTVHDKLMHRVYIGYGLDMDGQTLLDLWVLDTDTYEWSEIPLSGDAASFSPRVGASAVLSRPNPNDPQNVFLIIFGGYSSPTYFGELHSIRVKTGEVKRVETSGPQPEPRSTPITALYNNKYFIWGGYNGRMISELFVLDIATREWSVYPQDIQGRTAIPSAIIGSKMYSFGSSKQNGIVSIDLDNNYVHLEPDLGSEPPTSVMDAGMCAVDDTLFFFGGKSTADSTLLYACDTKRNWWYVFHTQPDGNTVSQVDGKVTKDGLFMLPRLHGFTLFYNEPKRELVATLGEPMMDPPKINVIYIGEALGVVHLRDDMLDMFRSSN